MLSILLLIGIAFLGGQIGVTNNMLLDATLPSVYIRYERQGERTPVRLNESQEGVWVRIHNNTRGAISLCTENLYVGPDTVPLRLANGEGVLALKEGIEASVCYFVQAREMPPESNTQGDVAIDQWNQYHFIPLGYFGSVRSISWVPSGGSILFSFPKEYLVDLNRISVAFNYEWESGQSRNIDHVVYFYATDLSEY